MTKTRGWLLLILLLIPAAGVDARTQEQTEHAIDKAMGVCVDRDPSTAGMTQCIFTAAEAWDRELNKNYNKLLAKLDAKGKQTLKAAQLEWIRYRDAEYKLIDAVYFSLEGSMYVPMRAEDRLRVVKKRALELASYLGLIEEQ
jgi:uncharacterized protein YecT (DUF1311 family)